MPTTRVVCGVGGHRDLPASGHEDVKVVITESDQTSVCAAPTVSRRVVANRRDGGNLWRYDLYACYAAPVAPHDRRLRRLSFWLALALAVALFITGLAVTLSSVRQVADAGLSMENTIRPGDKLLYVPASGLRRGDVVLERVAAPPGAPDLIARRVIGVPGDHVSCCGGNGEISVDSKRLNEAYLYPGDAPSAASFSVTLPSRQYWLLGDHRSVAFDSRTRGPIPQAVIAGRVVAVIRGASLMTLRTPPAFAADGLAPMDTRDVLPIGWVLLSAAALVALLGLSGLGVTGVVARRRRLAS
jgi:signal peptidase I